MRGWQKTLALGGALGLAVTCGLGGPVRAETLADVRQDLAVLIVELRKLKRELSTTGAPGAQVSGDALARINAIEGELQRLTAKTEQLEHRVGRVAKDGANRVGDLQFRICELDPGCDIASLSGVDPLGGEVPSVGPETPAPVTGGTDSLPVEGELAVSEEADFRAAQAALDAGNGQLAADLFARFRETYPQGPLEPAALIGEGRGLDALGDTRAAARRYLDAYSAYPDAQVAPEALWRLGMSLGALGSVHEACVTLGEVANRYPGSTFVSAAAQGKGTLNCP